MNSCNPSMSNPSFNIAYFSNQFAGPDGHGIRRYARHLYLAMSEVRPDLNMMPVAAWSRHGLNGKKRLVEQYGVRFLPWGRRLTPLVWSLLDWPPIERWMGDAVDLVHAVSLGYPIATRKPYVVTVHDIGPLTHPEFFTNTWPWIMKKSLKQALKRADALICVSHATAAELTGYVGDSLGDRIRVAQEGVSTEFFKPADPTALLSMTDLPPNETPFILATGKISPRKNVPRIIRALSKIADAVPHHLVLVGGDGWDTGQVLEEIRKSGIEKRVHMPGYVDDDQLRALYSCAELYVHPSLYEGFGLTILEAMAAGCPVVTSNTSSLPEVAGDAAILVDPCDTDEIAEAIRAVCMDASIAGELRQRGWARAKSFTWDRCARKVADVYKEVAP